MTALFVVSALLLAASLAHATPINARMYKQQFGYMPNCSACHSQGGGSKLNDYGAGFKKHGQGLAAFQALAALDSDKDSSSNSAEATAKANPGDARSTPKVPGDWLSSVALIPKEVQALFPGVRQYLPRDAVLTPADISRAKALGALLKAQDENTIYIPLGADQRPTGTALIFAAEFQGKPFFLLLATDRSLKVTHVQVLNTNQVPAAAKSKLYARFQGFALDQLPSASGSDLDAAITTAVKKAGTLVYVRLKNA